VSRTCDCSTSGGVTSQEGSCREHLVAKGSIQDPRGYLPVVLDQGSGYVESHFPLQVASPIELSPLPETVQVSPDHWPLQGWKDRGSAPDSTAIPLPLQDIAFDALIAQTHRMRAGCPAPR
jgi:hypothetical protein